MIIMRLPPGQLRILGWVGAGLAAVLLILTYTPLGWSAAATATGSTSGRRS